MYRSTAMRELPGALKLWVLEEGETYDGLNDGKERTPDCVVVRKDGEWIDNLHGNPADQITEEQAEALMPDWITHQEVFETGSCKEIIINRIAKQLKENKLELL